MGFPPEPSVGVDFEVLESETGSLPDQGRSHVFVEKHLIPSIGLDFKKVPDS